MASQKIIVCEDCGKTACHKGRGLCTACYSRMVYHRACPDAKYVPPSGVIPPWQRPREHIATCWRCTIYIGPGYMFEVPHELGGHTYCSWCYEELLLSQYKRAA